jgi:uncharacterized protein (TIGR02466 family)
MDTKLMFPVPLWCKQVNFDDKTIKDIKDLCIEMSKKITGRVISNRGGYQSNDISKELFKKYPFNLIYKTIYETIVELTKELNIDERACLTLSNSWININSRGDYNVSHNHTRSIFSGILYISSCNEKQGVIFENPHPVEQYYLNNITSVDTILSSRSYRISSQPGMMYVFPSWIMHQVPHMKVMIKELQ